ncbi:hypothetical protein BC828DRAFT_333917, partial [Blastocladiella britannica]
RLHLSGFREPLTAQDLSTRFASFGAVSDVSIPESITGHVRGFAHFTVTAPPASVTRLVSLYNGTRWKGGTVHV